VATPLEADVTGPEGLPCPATVETRDGAYACELGAGHDGTHMASLPASSPYRQLLWLDADDGAAGDAAADADDADSESGGGADDGGGRADP
jgi:hypothetical protein